MRYSRLCLVAALAAGVAAGAQPVVLDGQAPAGGAASPASRFLSSLADVCGQAFAGRITANEPAQPDDPFVGQALVMHVRTCEAGRALVPFHVGADRSRTWVLTLHGDRLRLKHDHRHEDGTADTLTMYGGDSVEPGTANRQTFPADAFSKELFTRLGRSVSTTNTWAMEMHPGRMFAYELRRPGRLFRVEFDLTKPVPPPPAPWGHPGNAAPSSARTSPAGTRAEAIALVGTWRVVSLETIRPSGEALTEWMGKRPAGMLAYLPSGHVSVQFMRDPRPAVAGTSWAGTTPAEKLAAIDGYYAYFGTYEVDAGAQTVTHTIVASLRPHEVGLRYLRRFELEGDRLTLTSHTFQEAGEPRFNRVVWERVR